MTRAAVAQAFAEDYKPPNERAVEMARLYAEDELTYEQIGDRFGLSRQRVHQVLAPFGLPPHGGRRTREERRQRIRDAHARVVAGTTTLEEEAAKLGYKSGPVLRRTFNHHGLHMQPAEFEHGTRARYSQGCHCESCRGAEAEYRRKLRRKARREREPEE